MSIRALAWAFDQTTGSPISKLVLIKLADNANEQTGLCIPSIPTICQQTELSPRAIQQHIKKLEDLGLVRIERRMVGEVHVSNRYYLNIQGGASPAGVVHDMHHPGAPHAPPSRTTFTTPPSSTLGKKSTQPESEPELNLKNSTEVPQNLNNPKFLEAFDEFKAYRKEKKLPLGPVAAKRLLTTLSQRPNEAVKALGIAIDRNWRGFSWEWIENQNGQKPKRPVENAI